MSPSNASRHTSLWAVLLLAPCLISLPLFAAPADSPEQTVKKGRELLEKAGVDPNATELKRARPLFVAVTQNSEAKSDLHAWAHYYLALTDYRTIPAVQKKDKEALTAHLETAIRSAEKAIELEPKHAEAHALLSSLLGRKISLDPSQTMTLGMRSSQLMLTAKQIAPKNPRVLLLDGISKLHTPEQWGGGAKSALVLLTKSVEQFSAKEKASKLEPTWGEDEAHAWLGVTQLKLGKRKRARAAFERALEINPKFDWVRKELLPQCGE
ncbi:MAG: tetratricopeptide repeat protein [Planctomycetota bacterium]